MPTFNDGESGSSVRAKINETITVVDGLDTGDDLLMDAAERTKLAGIENGATADQTGAEIKALYEGEADTNAFTDANVTKLGNAVESDPAGVTGADSVPNMMSLTTAEYGAITPVADTLYLITDAT